MDRVEALRIHFDFVSGTVPLNLREHSHVLQDGFKNKDVAKEAATRSVRKSWGYQPPRINVTH